MKFKPGQSGNKLGRPKGAAGLAKYASSQTNDGQDVIDFLVSVMRNTRAGIKTRIEAAKALLDRTAGKPLQPTEISMLLSERPRAEALLSIEPEHRLAALDSWRARKQLGPGTEEQDDEHDETSKKAG